MSCRANRKDQLNLFNYFSFLLNNTWMNFSNFHYCKNNPLLLKNCYGPTHFFCNFFSPHIMSVVQNCNKNSFNSNKNINTIESLRTENNKLSYKRFHSHCFQQIKEAEKSCSNNLEKILKSHTKLDKTFRKSFRVKKIIDKWLKISKKRTTS